MPPVRCKKQMTAGRLPAGMKASLVIDGGKGAHAGSEATNGIHAAAAARQEKSFPASARQDMNGSSDSVRTEPFL